MVGIVGKVHPMKAKEDVYIFELDLDRIIAKKTGKMKYKEISKYPTIKKDLAIIVDEDITNDEIKKQIKKSAGGLLIDMKLFDVYTGVNIQKGKK